MLPTALDHPVAPLLIALAAEHAVDDDMVFDRIGHHYLEAIALTAAAIGGPYPVVPLVMPTHADAGQIAALLSLVDGMLLPGSASNVDPRRYGQQAGPDDGPFDQGRDTLGHVLIHHALSRGLPLLGICRGFQEINVALGGSLRRELQTQPGMQDHREPEGASMEQAFSLQHRVRLRPDGPLAGWAGAPTARVNSLHRQGIDRLADSARAEAWSDDGLVESFTCPDAPGFVLAVQWHPEATLALGLSEDPALDTRLFDAFLRACIAHRAARDAAKPGATPLASGATVPSSRSPAMRPR